MQSAIVCTFYVYKKKLMLIATGTFLKQTRGGRTLRGNWLTYVFLEDDR